jgi:hypothetical protein
MTDIHDSTETPEPTPADAVPEPEDSPPAVVRITELAGEVRTVDYVEGQTVGEYLRREGIRIGRHNVVTVNSHQVGPDHVLEPNSVVAVVGKVTNG